MRIVIVDPDVPFRQALVSQLQRSDFEVYGVGDAASLYRNLLTRPCDAVVIDPALPDEDGYTVAGFLSGLKHANIVMLCDRHTAARSGAPVPSAVKAFLPKPFESRDLVATIDRLQTRPHPEPAPKPAPDATPGCWTLVTQGWQLIAPNRARISLTSYEYSLTLLLFERKGAVVTRHEIVSKFGLDYQLYDERRLEAIVCRLRRKLRPHQGASNPLRTAHGIGYAFTASVRIDDGLPASGTPRPTLPAETEGRSVPSSAA